VIETAHHLIARFGYAGIVLLLALGIVGAPVPDETLLAFSGYLVCRSELSLLPTLASGFLGTALGITLSYVIGRTLGHHLLERYGSYVHLTPERLRRAHAWFERLGKWTLPVGYFVPGLRHLVAYAAGATRLELWQFAVFAYSGGLAWSSIFILLGDSVCERWPEIATRVHQHVALGAGLVLVVATAFLVLRRRRPSL
jgi:membrane protein DedA with SNARE-associated domain